MNTREAIDIDLEFLYETAKKIGKLPTEAQEDDYLDRVKHLVIDKALSPTAARIKAFAEVVIK
jgi:hypothetical protein